jgi:hypothetical protein
LNSSASSFAAAVNAAFDEMILKCSHFPVLLKLQAQADEYTKSYCKSISQSELVGYRAEQKAFKEKYGEEAFEKQTRKRKNAEAAARGENKKSKSLKKYEEALKAMEEESEDESEEEEEQIDENEDDGKVPAVKDKNATAAAEVTAAAVTRAGPALAPFNPLDRLLHERQLIAQRLYMLSYGGIAQGNDQLGQAIRSMNQERMVAQDLAIQRALLREEMAQRSSHQGTVASMPHLDPRLAGMTHLDPRLAGMRIEQTNLRRGVDLAAASAPTDTAAVDISQEKSWASTPEEDRLEQLSLRLGGVAQRDRLAQIMRPDKSDALDRLIARCDSDMPEASTDLSSMQDQGSGRLAEGGGIVSTEARRNSPQQRHPQQDRMSLIMSLEGLNGKSANERMAAVSNPVVLDHIQNLQLLQQRRLQLQEQLLQQRLAQAAFLPGRTNALAGTALNGQLTQEEILRQEVEKRRAAALEQLKK